MDASNDGSDSVKSVNVEEILNWVDEHLQDEDAYSLWQAGREELRHGGEKAFVDFLSDSIDESIQIANRSLEEVEALQQDGVE